MRADFDSPEQQAEDQRIIVRAWDLVRQGEKLRWPAQKELAHAAARMAARFSDATTSQDYENERHDRKDDEDCPEHVSDSTQEFAPVLGWVREYGGGRVIVTVSRATMQYPDGEVMVLPASMYARMITPPLAVHRPITPEIQAVLDALPPIYYFIATRMLNREELHQVRTFEVAWQAYLASTEPPKPSELFLPSIGERARIAPWSDDVYSEGVEIIEILYPPVGRSWAPQAIGRGDDGEFVAWPLTDWKPVGSS